MIDYGKQQSTEKPNGIVVDVNNVWIYSNINELQTDSFQGWEFDMKQYTKDEYISLLDSQVLNMQLALIEVYELIGG